MMHASHGGIYNFPLAQLLHPAVLMQAQCQHLAKWRPMQARCYKTSYVRNSIDCLLLLEAPSWRPTKQGLGVRFVIMMEYNAWPDLICCTCFRSVISLEACPLTHCYFNGRDSDAHACPPPCG